MLEDRFRFEKEGIQYEVQLIRQPFNEFSVELREVIWEDGLSKLGKLIMAYDYDEGQCQKVFDDIKDHPESYV